VGNFRPTILGNFSPPLTTPDVTEIPALLDQIDSEIASVTADGAYDGEAVYDAVAARHPAAAVVIPPRATAVSNEATVTQRDRHIAGITTHGRMGEAAQGSARVSAWNGSGGWQRRSGYNRRSLVETGMVSLQDHRRLAA
jgi:transposase